MIDPSPSRSRFAERMALYYGALFLVYGVHVTYFPVWLSWRGLTPQEIGVITALPIFMRVVITPAIAAAADRNHNHRDVIIVLSLISAALVLVTSQCRTFWTLLLTAVPYSIAVASTMPLTETIAVAGARADGHDYGRMRLWGSLTFLLATLAVGALYDRLGADVGIWALVAATFATVGAAFLLPRAAGPIAARPRLIAGAGETSELKRLLSQPVFAVFLAAVGAIFGSHAAFYTFGALHLKGQGISGTAFGALWAISIFAEMAVFAVSKPLIARLGAVNLIMIAAAAGIIRWGAMSLDPPLHLLVVIQALHAATYGATHLGAMHFIGQAVPDKGAGQAQALYAVVGTGLITGFATLIAGQLYPNLAGQTFLVMGALSASGLAAGIWLSKSWNGRPLLKDDETNATPTALEPVAK
jgi:MFS transporter, PPP family, 3-phenylpropionic acid transporter